MFATQTKHLDDQFTAPSNHPLLEGYDFIGWRQKGYQTAYDFTTRISGDVTLEAMFSPITCLVKFQLQDGTILDSQIIDYGKTITLPTELLPNIDGQKFDCWTVDGEKFDTNQRITKSVTLVAKYTSTKLGCKGSMDNGWCLTLAVSTLVVFLKRKDKN